MIWPSLDSWLCYDLLGVTQKKRGPRCLAYLREEGSVDSVGPSFQVVNHMMNSGMPIRLTSAADAASHPVRKACCRRRSGFLQCLLQSRPLALD